LNRASLHPGAITAADRLWNLSEQSARGSLPDGNLVADADLTIGQNVGVESASVNEVLDDPRSCHLLEMQARLAQLDSDALDIADPETAANQIVEPHTPHDHLAPRLRTGQTDVLQRLGLDQGQRLAWQRSFGKEMPVALKPLAREHHDRADRRERLARSDIDLLDMHKLIMQAGAAEANPIVGRKAGSPLRVTASARTLRRVRANQGSPDWCPGCAAASRGESVCPPGMGEFGRS
jgi:hypothetical protein